MPEDREFMTENGSKTPTRGIDKGKGRIERSISPISQILGRYKERQAMESSLSPIRRRDKGKQPMEMSRLPPRHLNRRGKEARERSRSSCPEIISDLQSHWDCTREYSRSPQRRYGRRDEAARYMRRRGRFEGRYRSPLTRRQREKEYGLHRGAKMKLGFTTGMYPRPSRRSEVYEKWKRCNFMVMSWLLNSMTSEIAENFIYVHLL
ncbi:hypothetical protein OROHE_002781 [Orobanche hederae]